MKVRLYSISLHLLIVTAAGAQDPVIVDSLNTLLAGKTGADRYPPLYELAFEYIDRDNEKALEIIGQAEQAALLSGDSLWIVKSMRVKGQVLSRLDRRSESIVVCQDVLQIVRRNGFTEEEPLIINNLATSYSFLGKDDTALEYFLKTLEIAEASHDSSLLAQSLHNIGIFYYRLGTFQKALDYLLPSLKISKAISEVHVYHLNNIALCYASLHQFKKANSFVIESMKTCGSDCEENDLMIIRFTEALICLNKNEKDEAKRKFLQCYTSAKKQNAVRMQLEVIDLLAAVYLKENRIQEAKALLNEAERNIDAGYAYSEEVMAIYSRCLQLHRLTGNFKLIAHYSNKYITLKDGINNDALTASLMRTEADFRERQNLAKIAAQDEVILLKEEIISRQKLLNLVIGFLGITLFTFILFLFRNYQGKKELNKLLVQKVKQRTLQLEMNQNDLIKLVNERHLEIKRVSSIVTETVSTVQGLCFAGYTEIRDEKSRFYLGRILKTLERLSHNSIAFPE
jgi:tetratricopeptide (TPR) repeat protein